MIMNATNGLRGLSIRALGRTGRLPEEDERKDAMWWVDDIQIRRQQLSVLLLRAT
jgi:hypothetical protein